MLPNSKKHKEFLKMTNKNKILLAVFLFLTIAAIVLAEVRINFKNQENNTNIKPTYTAEDFEELKRIVLGEKYNMIFEKKKKI